MTHLSFVTVDLGFGDAGKGSIVDALVRKHGASLVVRFNGGAQAAHNVVDPEGRAHTFSQFGSGTFVPGVKTLLSEDTLIDPPALYFENSRLENVGISDAYERLFIHRDAKVVTPFQVNANRINEYIRKRKHGTCGRGIGQCIIDSIDYPDNVLYAGDLLDKDLLAERLRFSRDRKREEMRAWAYLIVNQEDAPEAIQEEVRRLFDDDEYDAAVDEFHRIIKLVGVVGDGFLKKEIASTDVTVFEAAQGVLLDQDWGFHPHNTWSKTTCSNALDLIMKSGPDTTQVHRVGITRGYTSRHGAGPLPTEDAKMEEFWKDTRNPENCWQGAFRYGWLDLNLLQYAIDVNGGIDSLAVTCLDQMAAMPEEYPWTVAVGYETNGRPWKLKFNSQRTYREQEALGKLLETVQPIYSTRAPRSMEEYGHFVAKKLGIRMSILSQGPKTTDKTFYEATEKETTRSKQLVRIPVAEKPLTRRSVSDS